MATKMVNFLGKLAAHLSWPQGMFLSNMKSQLMQHPRRQERPMMELGQEETQPQSSRRYTQEDFQSLKPNSMSHLQYPRILRFLG